MKIKDALAFWLVVSLLMVLLSARVEAAPYIDDEWKELQSMWPWTNEVVERTDVSITMLLGDYTEDDLDQFVGLALYFGWRVSVGNTKVILYKGKGDNRKGVSL